MSLSFQSQVAAAPQPFPPPEFRSCSVRRIRVRTLAGDFENVLAIFSNSGSIYEIGRQLKEAIYGSVHCSCLLQEVSENSYTRTPQLAAVKIIKASNLRQLHGRHREDPMAEIACMQYIARHGGHQNIVQLLEAISDGQNYFSIMEFVPGGELHDIIVDNQGVGEPLARDLLRQALSGMQFLHSIGICHRDLSFENIMVTPDHRIKIIDMGMAFLIPRNQATQEFLLLQPQGQYGKRNYMAPELVENTRPFHPVYSDIWAIGIVLFILLTAVPPMNIASTVDARFRIIAEGGLGNLLRQWNRIVSEAATDLMQNILRVNPMARLTTEQILAHMWMQV